MIYAVILSCSVMAFLCGFMSGRAFKREHIYGELETAFRDGYQTRYEEELS